MRIVIDMQGAQAENAKRGIGNLTLSLSYAMVKLNKEHEFFLALNDAFPESIDRIKKTFKDIIPEKNIRIWSPMGSVAFRDTATTYQRKVSELLREAFLASLNPSIVVIMSLFEGLVDNAVTSIGLLPKSNKYITAVFLHDLIPLIHKDFYLANPLTKHWYEEKLSFLKKADMLLCNSISTSKEAIQHVNFNKSVVFTVYAGVGLNFQIKKINEPEKKDIKERYNLSKPFIMYAGGIEHRKNVERLIHAFSKLPPELKENHQLVIVCAIAVEDKKRLHTLCESYNLSNKQIIFTGYVEDDDFILLYNLCKFFVFPSWHEGFGLPILEAMACGKAVIGGNLTSIPELIGLKSALFDPFNPDAIAAKMEKVITDKSFRKRLEQHSLQQVQKFSWEKSAQLCLQHIEKFLITSKELKKKNSKQKKPSLAYVSPLPPGHTGIADYSSELIPELNQHYKIDVVVDQEKITDPFIHDHCDIRSIEWFESHYHLYDRILYHFGNSAYHQHMFELLEKIPGVVVLHDFFLSGIVAHIEIHGSKKHFWLKELYLSHGYKAIQEFYDPKKRENLVWNYPCNKSVAENALGVIIHSKYSQQLCASWINKELAQSWHIIPHLRLPTSKTNKEFARRSLNLNDNMFIVCSFGVLGPLKQNIRLINAWIQSKLYREPNCLLVFVGENGDPNYAQQIEKIIEEKKLEKQIDITGWAEVKIFKKYLEAADVAVQLRKLSRGETSGTVLDCMNYGLPVIVNAHGSNANLPKNSVYMLNDEFTDTELASALEDLWQNHTKRAQLGENARQRILHDHNPKACAEQYVTAIEKDYSQYNKNDLKILIHTIASQINNSPITHQELINLSTTIAQSHPNKAQKQIFLDISELVQRDSKSGIQRVVRNILKELINDPPEGYRIEPVYANTNQEGYRYAHNFTLSLLNCPIPDFLAEDSPIDAGADDLFFGLDLAPAVISYQVKYLRSLKYQGVNIKFLVHDLLPIQYPDFFVPGGDDFYKKWLYAILEFDGIICVSKATSHAFDTWVQANNIQLPAHFTNLWSHNGADLKNANPTIDMPNDSSSILETISKTVSFLMVGTIEPRKGHAQILTAFEKLWSDDKNINLIIVGKQGWLVEELIDQIVSHPEKNKKLFWLQGVSDLYLEKIYKASTCLIAASYGEGFGLPLIEAAQYDIPIIARDIPVFREIAGPHAFYFNATTVEEMSSTIEGWLGLYQKNQHPKSTMMPYLTWKESAEQLKKVLKLS
ncbi:glycosyltransferase [Desulfococcaceae bacterium OttesenSCG-928-F15]|nr:glycosyltransferase [Desulfococcaceae bacterium OttesenSCG-928-F15]